MIDLHSHILPAVDDGAPDLETSLAMLRMAVDDGITTIAATPHSYVWQAGQPAAAQIADRVADLVQQAQAAAISISIVAGMEILIQPDMVGALARGELRPLGHSRAVLVELPFATWPPALDTVLFQLQVAGYRPVLAHAERYAAVLANPTLLRPLIERDVLIQITSTSLTGLFGPQVKALAEQLLEAQMAHLIASDSHSLRHRPPALAAARQVATTLVGPETACWLVETVPQAILNDQPLVLPEPQPLKRKRKKIFGIL